MNFLITYMKIDEKHLSKQYKGNGRFIKTDIRLLEDKSKKNFNIRLAESINSHFLRVGISKNYDVTSEEWLTHDKAMLKILSGILEFGDLEDLNVVEFDSFLSKFKTFKIKMATIDEDLFENIEKTFTVEKFNKVRYSIKNKDYSLDAMEYLMHFYEHEDLDELINNLLDFTMDSDYDTMNFLSYLGLLVFFLAGVANMETAGLLPIGTTYANFKEIKTVLTLYISDSYSVDETDLSDILDNVLLYGAYLPEED